VRWGDDGESLWRQSSDGFVGYGGRHRRQLQDTINRIVSGAIVSDASDAAGCLRLPRRTYSLNTFYPPQGIPAEIAFDVRTSEIAFARIEPDGANLRLHDVSYISSAEGRTIGSWIVGVEEFHGDRTTIVAPKTPIDYGPPVQRAAPPFRPFSLPVAPSRGGSALTTTISVNGIPGRFLVDTGANDFVVTAAFAKRAGVRPQGDTMIVGGSTAVQGSLSRAGHIMIGPVAIHDEPIVIREQAFGYDGLLGLPLFRMGVVRFERGGRSIAVSPSIEPSSPAFLPLDTYFGVPEAEAAIGAESAAFIIDTGAPIDYIVPGRFVSTQRAKPVSVACPIENAVPSLERFRYVFPSITFGHTTYPASRPCVFDSTKLLERDDLGIAGFDVIRAGGLIMDYRARRYFHGNESTAPATQPLLAPSRRSTNTATP
jgi:hypothetical protein